MPPLFVPAALRLRTLAAVAWSGVACVCLATTTPSWGASAPAVKGRNGMVVSPDAHATRVGVEVLKSGGNAVDASVAVALAMAVTYPAAGNLGGGGMLIHRNVEAEHFALDFRETAPKKLRAELFLDEDGRPVPSRSLDGGLAIGVPGTVAGLAEAHRLWGSRPWADLVAPAVRLARDGFEVTAWMEETLDRSESILLAHAATRAIFAPEGTLLREGERLVQPELARTLERIAQKGADGFYGGPVAAAVARTVQEHGGVIERRDLAKYEAIGREPLSGSYRGYRIVAFPPPSSGGVAMLQILKTLERFDLRASGFGSSVTIHWMAEAERRAFADRSRWLGDPDFVEVPIRQLLDDAYVAARAETIRPDRATPSANVAPGEPLTHDRDETTHLSVVDRRGAAVSMTVTLNRWYGTGIVASGTGVLLNDEMDDFAMAPGMPNAYGLVGDAANAVAGGKRPLSSMTPTIVESPGGGNRPFLVLGTPGGSTIITTVTQVLVNVIDHGMTLQEAVDAPRFHHQWQPDVIRHEIRAFPADVEEALVGRGHRLEQAPHSIGNVNAIGLSPDGVWLGAADPRRQGLAEGY